MLPLAVRDLEVHFAGLDAPALAVPDLRIGAGERIAVTGASGSGKTTLLNMLTGLDRAPRGSIRWEGTDLAVMTERQRDRWRGANVGLVMQDFHLFPGLSALDNVLLPQRLRWRGDVASAAAARLLDRVGIARHGQCVETLSRGQMQRVAVARALARRPGILVADEPTASLDEESGGAVVDLLLELVAETGTTLIVASHDPRLVTRLDRLLRLDNGRLQPPGS